MDAVTIGCQEVKSDSLGWTRRIDKMGLKKKKKKKRVSGVKMRWAEKDVGGA